VRAGILTENREGGRSVLAAAQKEALTRSWLQPILHGHGVKPRKETSEKCDGMEMEMETGDADCQGTCGAYCT